MGIEQLLAAAQSGGWTSTLDRIIENLSREYSAVWVVIVATLLVFTIKSLLDFNKGNHSHKVKVHDNLDQHAFQNAVVPLLLEFNNELKTPTLATLQLEGHEKPDEIISKYEDEKRASAAQADLSILESSIKVSDALNKMLDSKTKRSRYDTSYRRARKCLMIGTITLSLNMAVGIGLVLAHTVFNSPAWARGFLVGWLAMAIVNIILAALFIFYKTRMDGFIDEVQD